MFKRGQHFQIDKPGHGLLTRVTDISALACKPAQTFGRSGEVKFYSVAVHQAECRAYWRACHLHTGNRAGN